MEQPEIVKELSMMWMEINIRRGFVLRELEKGEDKSEIFKKCAIMVVNEQAAMMDSINDLVTKIGTKNG